MNRIISYHDFIFELHTDNVENVRKKWYLDLDEKEFEEIISADPTTIITNGLIKKIGNYSKWLIQLYKSGSLLLEDLYKATEYLTLHKKNYSTLTKLDKRFLNVFNFKSINDLYDAIRSFDKPKTVADEKTLITNRYYINLNEANLVFENDLYFVVNPITIEAENFYGINSKWCTIRPDQWKSYTDRGLLYIIIVKSLLNTNDDCRRVQLHVETKSYMDIKDRTVDYHIYLSDLKEEPEMKPIIDDLIDRTGSKILTKAEVLDIYLKPYNGPKGSATDIDKIIGRYNYFGTYTDEEYLSILDVLSSSNCDSTKLFDLISKNRFIDDDIYYKLYSKLTSQQQLDLILKKGYNEKFSAYLTDESIGLLHKYQERIGAFGEKIYKSEMIKFFSKKLDDDAYNYARSKSKKWVLAMLLYALDNISDIITIKSFLLRFNEELVLLKNMNRPSRSSDMSALEHKFTRDIMDKYLILDNDVNESKKIKKLKSKKDIIKHRQEVLDLLIEAKSNLVIDYRNVDQNQTRVVKLRAELNKIPSKFRKIAADAGIYIVFFSGDITDNPEFAHNKGVTPRNWPANFTWDAADGAFDGASGAVMIGIDGPNFAHQGRNIVLHEFGHALDDVLGDYYYDQSLSEVIDFKTLSKTEPFYSKELRNPNYFNMHEREYIANSIDLYFKNARGNAKLQKENPTVWELINSLVTNR